MVLRRVQRWLCFLLIRFSYPKKVREGAEAQVSGIVEGIGIYQYFLQRGRACVRLKKQFPHEENLPLVVEWALRKKE